MKIKNLEFKNNLILAPMAGYTDLGFRLLCEKYGAGATVTEMVSAKALSYDSLKTKKLLKTDGLKNIKIAQIFGHDPKIMSEAIKLDAFKDFDMIDINMGCPANKIIKNEDGANLMKNLKLAEEIISSCVRATNKPISVKFRKGYDENHVNAVEFAQMCERAGASLITVHGRTREQMYSGKADYEIIRKVKEAVNIPVCANGDVKNREDYKRILKETGADFVMIGRGSLGNPYVFADILNLDYKKDIINDIKFQFEIMNKIYSERTVVNNMRKIIAFYLKGFKNSNIIKEKIFKCTTQKQVFDMLNSFEELI